MITCKITCAQNATKKNIHVPCGYDGGVSVSGASHPLLRVDPPSDTDTPPSQLLKTTTLHQNAQNFPGYTTGITDGCTWGVSDFSDRQGVATSTRNHRSFRRTILCENSFTYNLVESFIFRSFCRRGGVGLKRLYKPIDSAP